MVIAQSVSTGYTHKPALKCQCRLHSRGYRSKCQYMLYSQTCRSSVSTGYTHVRIAQCVGTGYTHRPVAQVVPVTLRTAARVSVKFTLAGVLLNMSIDVTLTGLPSRSDPYQLHAQWNAAKRVVFLASKGTSERVQHSSGVGSSRSSGIFVLSHVQFCLYIYIYIYIYIHTHSGADKSLARPTSRCILFDG